jgi:hypothetical protein
MPTLRNNRGPLQAVSAGHPMTAPTLLCDGRGDIFPFLIPTTIGNIVYTHIYRAGMARMGLTDLRQGNRLAFGLFGDDNPSNDATPTRKPTLAQSMSDTCRFSTFFHDTPS